MAEFHPLIAETVINREGRPIRKPDARGILRPRLRDDRDLLKGEIVPGEVFAWEPDLPGARELVVVSRIEEAPGSAGDKVILDTPRHHVTFLGSSERQIWCWDFPDYRREVSSDEGRFREACYRTLFNLMPTSRQADQLTLLDVKQLRAVEKMLRQARVKTT